jgi:hypothetical protein
MTVVACTPQGRNHFRGRTKVALNWRIRPIHRHKLNHDKHHGQPDNKPPQDMSKAFHPLRSHSLRSNRLMRHVFGSGHGRIATFSTPSRREPKRSYASMIWSNEKLCVINGVGSKRLDCTIDIKRRIRSFPPGQSVVTIR